MQILRAAGVAVVFAAAWWFDAAHVNRWVSMFVITAGTNLAIFGPTWRDPVKPGSRASFGLPYRWRLPGGVSALALACWLLIDGMLATSAVTTWFALMWLTYQAPWPQRAVDKPEPS